jgi:hypothetical protein
MYIIVGIHRPKPGKEQAVLEAIEKFGRAQRGHKGALTLFAWKDDATGALIGTAIWDSKNDYEAALPEMIKEVEGIDFEPLEQSSEVYRGSPVGWT